MTTAETASLLTGSPYQGYAYAYPHKTAYRRLSPPIPLGDAWATQPREALFGYVHIPFCEMRCGFCNLLTLAHPEPELVDEYLSGVERQVRIVRTILPDTSFARYAVGGGTPTYLNVMQLEKLFDILRQLGIEPDDVPGSIETSPATATPERIALIRDAGVTRISIGIQTFCAREASKLGRTQPRQVVDAALDTIMSAGIPCVNIDLMYGGEGQTLASWRNTVRTTIEVRPKEVYLYPLYVRPETGLWQRDHAWDDHRLAAYRTGRDLLLEHGYQQVSMRLFCRGHSISEAGPDYCCQRDGMIGLGCGARSYTSSLHYATEYAVRRAGVRTIIDAYLGATNVDHGQVSHGVLLDREEQVRRFTIKSLLRKPGLDRTLYRSSFGSDVFDDLPQIRELLDLEMATLANGRIDLTPKGLERSDAIGPWLYSPAVRALAESYACL